MNDKDFQQLRRQIHKKMVELLVLQRLHHKETGQDYVISGPLPEPEERSKMSKTCADCILRNNDEIDEGHCYIWRVWPDEKICGNFIPIRHKTDNQPLNSDTKKGK